MNTGSTIIANRHLRILDFLKKKGKVEVDTLSTILDVSPVTVRRDLDTLSKKGFLLRTHGGASSLDTPFDPLHKHDFFKKEITCMQEKKRIAAKAAELVKDDSIVFLNSGTTTLFFLEALREKHVRVLTNNAAAITMQRDQNIEFFLIGGEYRKQSRAFVGDIALKALEGVYSDYTFLGTHGISLQQGLMSTAFPERSINQAMIDHTSGKVVVLADHSKLGISSNFITASLDTVDILITDTACPPSFVETLRDRGITVYIT